MKEGVSPVREVMRSPSLVDFPGHLAGVLFVSGCNFRCGFCHNPDLIHRDPANLAWAELYRACEALRLQWVDGAVITGGEPTCAEDLAELIRMLRGHGWAVKMDTNGSRPDVLEMILPLIDYIAMDVKCDVESYSCLTGFDRAADIRRSIDLIKREAKDYEFRTTVLPSFHDDARMEAIGSLVSGARRYVLQPFRPRPDLPDAAWRDRPGTAPERLVALKSRMAGCAQQVTVCGA